MSVLTTYFDYDIDQRSPVVDDYVRVVKHDEKGEEYVSWEKFNSADYQKSLGPVENWTLENLMKAGIDPRFNISTGYNSRLDGIGEIENAEKIIDTITKEEPKKEE